MALSTSKGFRFRKHLLSAGAQPEPIQVRVGNSQTITIGQCVRINTSGFAVAAGAASIIAGVVIGIVDDQGLNPFSLIYDTTATGVTLAPSSPGTEDKVTTSSTNQTAAHYILVEIAIDPAGLMLFYNLASATGLSQTNIGQFYNLTAGGDQIDAATNSDTSGVFQLVQLDPDGDGSTQKGLFRIVTEQFAGFVSNATAVRVA